MKKIPPVILVLGLLLAAWPALAFDNEYAHHSRGDAEFVASLYRAVLHREPDRATVDYWLGEMKSGHMTREKLMLGLLTSPEYGKRHTDDREFVRDVYQAVLGRGPDYEGWDEWTARLGAGMSRRQVVEEFIYSEEYGDLRQANGQPPLEPRALQPPPPPGPSVVGPKAGGPPTYEMRRAELMVQIALWEQAWLKLRSRVVQHPSDVYETGNALRLWAGQTRTSEQLDLVARLGSCCDRCFQTLHFRERDLSICLYNCQKNFRTQIGSMGIGLEWRSE